MMGYIYVYAAITNDLHSWLMWKFLKVDDHNWSSIVATFVAHHMSIYSVNLVPEGNDKIVVKSVNLYEIIQFSGNYFCSVLHRQVLATVCISSDHRSYKWDHYYGTMSIGRSTSSAGSIFNLDVSQSFTKTNLSLKSLNELYLHRSGSQWAANTRPIGSWLMIESWPHDISWRSRKINPISITPGTHISCDIKYYYDYWALTEFATTVFRIHSHHPSMEHSKDFVTVDNRVSV